MKSIFLFTLSLIFFCIQSDGWAQYSCVEGDCTNGIGKKEVEDGLAFLQGEFKNGILKEGTVKFQNGSRFVGKFRNHKLIQGVKVFPNGSALEGEFIEGVLVNGTITYQDGTTREIKLKPLGGKR